MGKPTKGKSRMRPKRAISKPCGDVDDRFLTTSPPRDNAGSEDYAKELHSARLPKETWRAGFLQLLAVVQEDDRRLAKQMYRFVLQKPSPAPSVPGRSGYLAKIHKVGEQASFSESPSDITCRAVSCATELYERLGNLLDKVTDTGLSPGARYEALRKLTSAVSALRPPGPISLSDHDLLRTVRRIMPLWEPWQALVAYTKESNEPPADLLGRAWQGDKNARDALQGIAPDFLGRRLSPETRNHLSEVLRWRSWRTFVACVLAGEHGGKPARWIDRLRDISPPKTKFR